MRDFRAFIGLSLGAMACGFAASPALAVDCRRPADAPREIAKRQVDCRNVPGGEAPVGAARRGAGGDRGFIDLGNGTSVRISGRVRAETVYRR